MRWYVSDNGKKVDALSTDVLLEYLRDGVRVVDVREEDVLEQIRIELLIREMGWK